MKRLEAPSCAEYAPQALAGAAQQALSRLGGLRAAHGRYGEPRIFVGTPADAVGLTFRAVRLLGTVDYLYAVGFGDDVLAHAAVRRVNAAHVPVRATADEGRPAYSAFDSDAQRWVASTLAAVALDLHERLSGPLDEATADAIVRGYADVGHRLQAARQGWPQTRVEFDA